MNIVKIGPNYFHILKILSLGLVISVYPCYVMSEVIAGHLSPVSSPVIAMFIILIIAFLIISYSILSLFKNYILIEQDKIVISSALNKKEVLINRIIRIERIFQKNRDTSFFGKTTYKILTTTKTFTVTSENYAKLEILVTHFSKNNKN